MEHTTSTSEQGAACLVSLSQRGVQFKKKKKIAKISHQQPANSLLFLFPYRNLITAHEMRSVDAPPSDDGHTRTTPHNQGKQTGRHGEKANRLRDRTPEVKQRRRGAHGQRYLEGAGARAF